MRKELLAVTLLAMLSGCANTESIETPESGKEALSFQSFVGKQTRAAEFMSSSWKDQDAYKVNAYYYDNSQVGDAAWVDFFKENLTYHLSPKGWYLSGVTRFNVPYQSKFVSCFSALDAESVIYSDQTSEELVDFTTSFPTIVYNGGEAGFEDDLLVAVSNNEPYKTAINIPFSHVKSQVNFAVKEDVNFKITIKELRIEHAVNSGVYTLSEPNSTAYGTWTLSTEATDVLTKAYSYAGGATFTTEGTRTDATYVLGDGGNFAPGENGYLYVFGQDDILTKEAAQTAGAKLANSIMVLPHSQAAFEAAGTCIKFTYSATDLDGNQIAVDATDGTATEIEKTIYLADIAASTGKVWEQNRRYLYVFEFDFETRGFTVDIEDWSNADAQTNDPTASEIL